MFYNFNDFSSTNNKQDVDLMDGVRPLVVPQTKAAVTDCKVRPVHKHRVECEPKITFTNRKAWLRMRSLISIAWTRKLYKFMRSKAVPQFHQVLRTSMNKTLIIQVIEYRLASDSTEVLIWMSDAGTLPDSSINSSKWQHNNKLPRHDQVNLGSYAHQYRL